MLNCTCEIAPIIRFINDKVLDGCVSVDVTKFESILSDDKKLEKLNHCLTKNGFNGFVSSEDFDSSGELDYTYWSK